MLEPNTALDLSTLAALGTLGSVCAVLLRSTHKNLESLEQMRREATTAIEHLRAELRDNDEVISKLQRICAEQRFHILTLHAAQEKLPPRYRRQFGLEVERLGKVDKPNFKLITPEKGEP